MKVGDNVRATWSDGLILTGIYELKERGYIVLRDNEGNRIVCNIHDVKFEVINESR